MIQSVTKPVVVVIKNLSGLGILQLARDVHEARVRPA
eukprot:CAMPEP_0119270006 /NCGR_PEP_ID=MMETSP1329-20130426/7180_1 /TAXON_ID=114041 /ORGANISM="Genus nov. species nov., Strain RCC1024" /LENGTH=36 /DNA_ID= /DNA_START= /DNA_END= /DNA_ORIENTATION=